MMSTHTVHLHDAFGQVLATAVVSKDGGTFAGTVDLTSTPPDARDLFEEFEEVVNGQMLSLVDDVADRIAALHVTATLDNKWMMGVENLQVFPTEGTISFAVGPPTPRMIANHVGQPDQPSEFELRVGDQFF